MAWLTRNKTFVTAAGLIGLAVYQFTIGQPEAAMTSLVAGFGLIFEGVRE